jgi:hypothetical protein
VHLKGRSTFASIPIGADGAGNELVSPGLNDDGRHTFYAERKDLPRSPTGFVETTVYPLLERGAGALTDDELRTRLVTFLDRFVGAFILYDNENDGWLLDQVLCSWLRFTHRPSVRSARANAVCRPAAAPVGHRRRWNA